MSGLELTDELCLYLWYDKTVINVTGNYKASQFPLRVTRNRNKKNTNSKKTSFFLPLLLYLLD